MINRLHARTKINAKRNVIRRKPDEPPPTQHIKQIPPRFIPNKKKHRETLLSFNSQEPRANLTLVQPTPALFVSCQVQKTPTPICIKLHYLFRTISYHHIIKTPSHAVPISPTQICTSKLRYAEIPAQFALALPYSFVFLFLSIQTS